MVRWLTIVVTTDRQYDLDCEKRSKDGPGQKTRGITRMEVGGSSNDEIRVGQPTEHLEGKADGLYCEQVDRPRSGTAAS